MQSKRMVVAGFGLGALLVAVGACGQGSRSDTASKNGSTTQGDNASPAASKNGSTTQGDNASPAVLRNGTTTLGDNASAEDAHVMACTDVTGHQIGVLMSTSSPTMNGSFLPHGSAPPAPPPTTDVAPTCDNPLAMPPVAAGSDFHYQSYTFANDGDATACVSVLFSLGFIMNGPILEELSGVETLAYLDRFDPTDIQKNYIAGYFGLEFGNGMPAPNTADFASGAAGIIAPFSFKVPAHAKFVVVVSGKEKPPQDLPPGQTALLFPYTLDVTNCSGQSDGGRSETDAGTSSGGTGKTW